jgi:predicted secreted protein
MPGKAGFGSVVNFGTTTGTTTSATLANVTNIAGLDGETEIIDVTSHDSSSAYREKVASFIDAGQLTLDVNFDPNSATHRATSGGVMWLRDQRIVAPWKVTFPGTPVHSVSFMAIVKNAGFEDPFDDKMTMSVTLEVSGSATWSYGT